MESVSIGLDIGASAIRAAEVEVNSGRRVLRRYAQVGLPPGYVVDGEIVNAIGVTEALRRLWAEGGFTTNSVVVGVSGPRVFVRQADVPAMSPDDLRASLRLDGQELVPIPLDEAAFDFSIIERGDGEGGQGSGPGEGNMRILLVAAHLDALHPYLTVLKDAGLNPVAMDSSALALMRAVPAREGMDGHEHEALVSIGADLTTVAVRRAGVPRFIRTLTIGGAKLTASLASSMHLELASAERLKRGACPEDLPQLAQARRALRRELLELAEEVRATVDFFAAQLEGSTISRLLITGGASQTEGLAAAIGGNLPIDVVQVPAFTGLPIDQLSLDEGALDRAATTATTPLGLALWAHESPVIRLSVLPEEVAKGRQIKRLTRTAAVSLACLAGVLAVGGAAEVLQVHNARAQAQRTEDQVTALTAQTSHLQAITAVHGKMLARGHLDVTALNGDIDWVRLLGQLAAVMPPSVHIQSFTASRASPAAGSGAPAGAVGTVSMSVQGSGNAATAAAWLDGLRQDPSLSGTSVGAITVTPGAGSPAVNFSSTSDITSSAQSSRAKDAQP